jgi:hypothetical protein
VLFSTAGFFLFCLVGLDYYQNCSELDCAAVHAYLHFFDVFDFAVVFPIFKFFPMPITLRLFVPCVFLFSVMLLSFFGLRALEKGSFVAFMDSFQLALGMILLFEIGLYFLDPDWWLVHFSNITSFPFSVVTNEDIAITAAALLFVLTLAKYAVMAGKIPSVLEKLTPH